ncbi:MAG: rhodanese-like domain-containing protein [Coriobacteriia bacterium]|nr:rhodanese-like domain-containing protein [Coriobacteriia bacterium]
MAAITVMIAMMGMLLTACTDNSNDNAAGEETAMTYQAATYQLLSASKARDAMNSGEPYTLVDVRTPEEFAQEHIADALLLPYDQIGSQAASELPDKNALILIYCRSGRRSEVAARELLSMGYTSVYDFGGITDWPYDTVSESN